MKSLDIGIIRTLININDLRLFNPPGHEDRVMLDMPEMFVDCDLPAVIRGRIHLEKVRINLEEFNLRKSSSFLLVQSKNRDSCPCSSGGYPWKNISLK